MKNFDDANAAAVSMTTESSATLAGTSAGPVLAIDFGLRRIGLALSDPDRRFATPLETLERRDDRTAARAIGRLACQEGVTTLVLGDPRRLDGSRGDASERIDRFADRLRTTLGLPLVRIIETLTSHDAEERLRDAGVDPRRHPDRIDAVAAQILLEEYLSSLPHATSRASSPLAELGDNS